MRGPRNLGWRTLAARTTLLRCKAVLCPAPSKLEKLEAQLQQLERKGHVRLGPWHAWVSGLKIGGAQLQASLKELHQRYKQLPDSEILRSLL